MEGEVKQEFKKGPWDPEEDLLLTKYIETHGEGKWSSISKNSGLMREGKSCRMRWKNYLRPNIKHGPMSPDEEDLIIRMHKLVGNRWSLIAGRIPGRTDNEIKNYWNTYLSKKKTEDTIVSSNGRKRKLLKYANTQPTSTEKTSNNTNGTDERSNVEKPSNIASEREERSDAANTSNNSTSETDERNEVQKNVPVNEIDSVKGFPCDVQIKWFDDQTTYYEEPFSPYFDSLMSNSLRNGLESWNDLSDDMYQFLL